ncbi:MAG: mechanosensitive ion channel [Verrucomicrobia bacterium]|nr:mechanosensitive ion channel [Verrucomicrobiota bacterium]
MNDLAHLSLWHCILILGYPVLAIAALEFARRFAERAPFVAGVLRQVSYVLLPTGAVWIILRMLAELPAENWGVRMAETAFALTTLYLLLRVAQVILMSLVDDQIRPPKLLFDVVRIGLSVILGSVLVSNIWKVNLGSILAAMGVGSIALAFALQEFLGNLLSGMALLSDHKFGIGDWIIVEGKAAQVLEMDWRTVTLLMAGGNKIIVAHSMLAKGNLTIAATAKQIVSVTVPVQLGTDVPPEQVRSAVIEAGQATPGLTELGGVQCFVTGIDEGKINYNVILPVPNPGVLAGPRDEFLSRFWYLAQRRGLRLDPSPDPDAAARLRILEQAGAFRRDPDTLTHLARESAFRRYRQGEILLTAGIPAGDAFLVVAGRLAVTVPTGGREIKLETVVSGQLLVLQEMMAGGLSPVRLVAEQDTDVLAIPPYALVAAMKHNGAVARDINAVTEARSQAILPFKLGMLVVPFSENLDGQESPLKQPRALMDAGGTRR